MRAGHEARWVAGASGALRATWRWRAKPVLPWGASLLPVVLGCGGLFTSTPPQRAAVPEVSSLRPLPETRLSATDARVGVMGRVYSREDGGVEFGYPGVTLRVCFRGTRLWVTASSSQGRNHFAVVSQGRRQRDLALPARETEQLAWQSPGTGAAHHCVDLVHSTETWLGVVTVAAIRVEGEVLAAGAFPERRLLFVGDSVTCGEAVRRTPECSKDESWWDASQSYGALAASALGAQYQLVCFGGKGVLRDWQGKAEGMNGPEFFPLTIPDERRLPYDAAQFVPDGIVISLGTNDFNTALGAFPDERQFVDRYVDFLHDVRKVYPSAAIWLTEGAIVNDVAGGSALQANQKSTLRRFLQQVLSRAGLERTALLAVEHRPGDGCDSHPTAGQHQQMADEVSRAVREQLGW